ncbi:hypothetical protein SPRG_12567 [Saprolegnia parasitica CBS 223.65]|uniref:RING-type domain-containing protein n=1 Tax=Saprolegnia parasitica (strain CBS 223.65) TaxID=695850 RepID=A0A067C710_SAPPC|nr:hypothetical protein SPRG_12567 [Saprolegnia parasitica CBS 223.65]KDO22587.1 hypothetical protein SPRG_12567 [Saprolegnia parasitica CBS 223.65]|eukprot:XP_012206703.1 hypothetical protein SPRG_12567 [Saprolegnia parasitica CBS 223.65]
MVATTTRVHVRALNVMAPASDKLSVGSEAFTVYVLVVACPETRSWWMLQKRYSQFRALRSELALARRAVKAKVPVLAAAIADALDTPFPRKHLMLTTDCLAVINQRKRGLQQFTGHLVALRALCLHWKSHDDDDKVRQLVQTTGALLTDFLRAPAMDAPATTATRALDCSICLEQSIEEDEMQTPPVALVMPCGHAFHEACLVKWLETDCSCPLCRTRATHGTVA